MFTVPAQLGYPALFGLVGGESGGAAASRRDVADRGGRPRRHRPPHPAPRHRDRGRRRDLRRHHRVLGRPPRGAPARSVTTARSRRSSAHALERGERFFARHGAKAVFFGRFVPGVRVVAALTAGASQMPWPQFAVYNATGAIVWAAVIAGLASLVGPVPPRPDHGRRPRAGRFATMALARPRRRAAAAPRSRWLRETAAPRAGSPAGRPCADRHLPRWPGSSPGARRSPVALRAPFVELPLGIDEGGLAFIAKAWGTGHGSLYGAYWIDRPPLLLAPVQARRPRRGARHPRARRAGGAGARRRRDAARARRRGRSRGPDRRAPQRRPGELGPRSPPCSRPPSCSPPSRRRLGPAAWWRRAGAAPPLLVAAGAARRDRAPRQAVLPRRRPRRRRVPRRDAFATARPRLARPLAYLAGAPLPLSRSSPGCSVAHVQAGELFVRAVGFRIYGLHASGGVEHPAPRPPPALLRPGAASGLARVLAAPLGGLRRTRGDRVLVTTLAAWLVAGAIGVLGGGSYWPHYLIQLVVPAACCAGAGRSRGIARSRAPASSPRSPRPPSRDDRRGRVAGRPPCATASSPPGATSAPTRGRVTRSTSCTPAPTSTTTAACQSPFPYAWSLMMRAIPGAPGRLARMLASPQRPTWIVGWQPPGAGGSTPRRRSRRALHPLPVGRAACTATRIYHRISPEPLI